MVSNTVCSSISSSRGDLARNIQTRYLTTHVSMFSLMLVLLAPVSVGTTQEFLGAFILAITSPAASEHSASRENDGGGAAGADEAPPEGTSFRAQKELEPRRTFERRPVGV